MNSETKVRLQWQNAGNLRKGQVEDGFGEVVVAVAEDFAFLDEVAGDGLDAECADAVEVGLDGGLAFEGVLGESRGQDGCGVDERVVEDFLAGVGLGVVENFFDVLGGGEAERLVGLGHEISDVDAGGAGGGDGFGNAADQEVGDERGVERAGAEGDEIGLSDGVEGFGQREGVGGREHELDDGLFAGCDAGLAMNQRVVVHARGEGGVGGGGGVDAAAGGEDLGAGLDGSGEIAGDSGERGEEEVAEVVALEIAVGEAVLEELGEEVLILGEGDEAVAEVAGGEHVEALAEAAGGAAVVGDGDDGGEFTDEAGDRLGGAARAGRRGLRRWVGRGDEVLEAAQQRRKAGTAADGDDAKLLVAGIRERHCSGQFTGAARSGAEEALASRVSRVRGGGVGVGVGVVGEAVETHVSEARPVRLRSGQARAPGPG
jgi:hypothetical protein